MVEQFSPQQRDKLCEDLEGVAKQLMVKHASIMESIRVLRSMEVTPVEPPPIVRVLKTRIRDVAAVEAVKDTMRDYFSKLSEMEGRTFNSKQILTYCQERLSVQGGTLVMAKKDVTKRMVPCLKWFLDKGVLRKVTTGRGGRGIPALYQIEKKDLIHVGRN